MLSLYYVLYKYLINKEKKKNEEVREGEKDRRR